MHSSNKLAYANIEQLILDLLFLILSYIIAYIISLQLRNLHNIKEFIWVPLTYIPLWMLIMAAFGMYNKTTFNYPDRILRNILLTSMISSMFLASVMYFIKETMFSRTLFSIFVVTNIIMLITEKFFCLYIIRKHQSKKSTNVIIIGNTDIALEFAYFLRKTNIKINVVGYVNVPEIKKQFKSKKTLGNIEDLEEILKDNVVDEVIFALPRDYVGEVGKYIYLCEEMGITVKMILNLYDLKIARTHLGCVGTLPVLTFHSVNLNGFELFLKRFIDICGAAVGLLITAVASIFIIPAIKLTSPGSVLFSQDRVGLNGRIFKIYKFRTMYIDAEARKKELMAQNQVNGGLMFKIKSDPRITGVGKILRKTSLDELPQFINVLKGDMSLVGTRPPTVDEVTKYENYHRRRISFKPGLTGMWQVSGRSNITDFDMVVKLDTQYIDQWSIWLDLKIILKTIWVVLKKSDAY